MSVRIFTITHSRGPMASARVGDKAFAQAPQSESQLFMLKLEVAKSEEAKAKGSALVPRYKDDVYEPSTVRPSSEVFVRRVREELWRVLQVGGVGSSRDDRVAGGLGEEGAPHPRRRWRRALPLPLRVPVALIAPCSASR